MMNINCEYRIKEDIGFILEAEKINKLELSEATKISRTTLDAIEKRGTATDEVCEKLYSYIYEHKYRLNSVKEELIREKYGSVLFHGSKYGLSDITVSGSRNSCDFGNGFWDKHITRHYHLFVDLMRLRYTRLSIRLQG